MDNQDVHPKSGKRTIEIGLIIFIERRVHSYGGVSLRPNSIRWGPLLSIMHVVCRERGEEGVLSTCQPPSQVQSRGVQIRDAAMVNRRHFPSAGTPGQGSSVAFWFMSHVLAGRAVTHQQEFQRAWANPLGPASPLLP